MMAAFGQRSAMSVTEKENLKEEIGDSYATVMPTLGSIKIYDPSEHNGHLLYVNLNDCKVYKRERTGEDVVYTVESAYSGREGNVINLYSKDKNGDMQFATEVAGVLLTLVHPQSEDGLIPPMDRNSNPSFYEDEQLSSEGIRAPFVDLCDTFECA